MELNMKNYLSAEINGKGFFKRFLLFYIPLLLLTIITNRFNESLPLLSSIASLAESYLMILFYLAVFIYAIRFVTFRDKEFGFGGSIGEAAPKMLKWYLLCIITLGIYSPWMIKHMMNYYLNRIDYEGKSGELLSKPGRLLKAMLLTVYLPIIVLMCIFAFFMIRSGYYDYGSFGSGMRAAGFTFIFIIVMFLVFIPFMYYYFTWILNIRFGEHRVEFRRNMSEFAGFLLPQILLSVVTVFIYYPSAIVKIYRYLCEGSVFCDENGNEKGGFSFDGMPGKGWALMWGQGLLTAITIGIYAPWAIAKIANWWLNNTSIESNA